MCSAKRNAFQPATLEGSAFQQHLYAQGLKYSGITDMVEKSEADLPQLQGQGHPARQ